jgi:MFS family permease
MPGPQLLAILADVVHPDLRGRTSAATTLVGALSTAGAPLTFGLLSDWFGLRITFLALIPLMGMGGIILLILGPRFLTRDLERMRQQLSGAEPVPMPGEVRAQEADSPALSLSAGVPGGPAKRSAAFGVVFDALCGLGILTALALSVAEAHR